MRSKPRSTLASRDTSTATSAEPSGGSRGWPVKDCATPRWGMPLGLLPQVDQVQAFRFHEQGARLTGLASSSAVSLRRGSRYKPKYRANRRGLQDLTVGFWLENRLLKLGYRNFKCDWCASTIWKVGFIVGFVDNTNGGFCPNCSNYID
jgi:hypothetical protein